MACFLVPAGEAIVTTVAEKIIEKTHTDSEKSKGIFLPRLGVHGVTDVQAQEYDDQQPRCRDQPVVRFLPHSAAKIAIISDSGSGCV